MFVNGICERDDIMDNEQKEVIENVEKTEKKKRRTVKDVELEMVVKVEEIKSEYQLKIDELEEQIKVWQGLYEEQQEVIRKQGEALQDIEQRHIDDVQEMKDELEHFKQWRINMAKGGRKQMLSESKKNQIVNLRDQRKTIRQIAEQMDISVGLVHKILKEKGYNKW